MGTNYYVHSEYRDGWHLGKRSARWPFLFHAQNDWDMDNAAVRWLEVLATPGAVIKDEYDRELSFQEFMAMIIKTYEEYGDRKHSDAFESNMSFQFIRGEFC